MRKYSETEKQIFSLRKNFIKISIKYFKTLPGSLRLTQKWFYFIKVNRSTKFEFLIPTQVYLMETPELYVG